MALAKLPVVDERPRTRSECVLPIGLRPCPFITCRHHALDVIEGNRGGMSVRGIALAHNATSDEEERFTDEVADLIVTLRHSCTLDVANRGDHTLEEVGEALAVTRERVRQLERTALGAGLRPMHRADLKPDRGGPRLGVDQSNPPTKR